MKLTVRVTDTSGGEYDTETLMISAALVQTLRVRAILVSYDGPSTSATPTPGQPDLGLQLAAPTLADVQATAARALRLMPVEAEGDFAQAGAVLPWGTPLDDPRTSPGSCSPNWDLLFVELADRRTNDGNRPDVVYYALLPAGIPLGVPGCGGGGMGSAAAGNERTFLHEIGHGYGFQHTPCGNTGDADVNYPTYEPYPSASIGEYGLDISTGDVLSPQEGATTCPIATRDGCRFISTPDSLVTRNWIRAGSWKSPGGAITLSLKKNLFRGRIRPMIFGA